MAFVVMPQVVEVVANGEVVHLHVQQDGRVTVREGPGFIGYVRRIEGKKKHQGCWHGFKNDGTQVAAGTTAEQAATSLFYRVREK